MGNCFSSGDPSALSELVNRRTTTTEEQLTKEKIVQGLQAVADTLKKARQPPITIVAVGGAVNTVLLKTRASTGDVDFFYRTKTKHDDVSKIIIAADNARTKLRLGEQWLNNHTAVFIEEGTIKSLYDEAIQQNEVVFSAPGTLTVYAAPWRYALAAKLDRLAKPGARPYDINDAVDYLSKLIAKRGTAVKRSELEQWAKEFKFTVPTKQLIDQLADEYKKKTHKDGIVSG
ncbi:hypothetical protein BJ138DRAFT_617829 [Hygrophoropsis aurantiaca]|uniref:Uncharacterized protein n=1 Tax=Hygrophoropsis aurantiaca TaxID=72124 RepID=A0ACB7ZZI5_9AGAM|nr:hypothetical protein BJ138DRAFT_617829 [Hygrophoropsis aurantiaca]